MATPAAEVFRRKQVHGKTRERWPLLARRPAGMYPERMPMPTLVLTKVREYNFAQHHVTPGFQATDIAQAARSVVGLHSARLPSPYVALHTRVSGFGIRDLRRGLLDTRNLIKLRCMRRTLHVVPLDLAPVVHQATLSFRVADCWRVFRRFGVPDTSLRRVREALVDAVALQPFSPRAIHDALPASLWPRSVRSQRSLRTTLVRTMIKLLWEEGVLCYLNMSPHWGSETRFYGNTQSIYPTLDLGSVSPCDAQRRLVRYHVDQFGPVTEADTSWWSGLGRATVRRCVQELDDIIPTRVRGLPGQFFMTRAGLSRLSTFQHPSEPWLCLLAYEDPSLKGYFDSRLRYVDAQSYGKLFNQIGESRASIVANGRVVGIWSWDKKKGRVRCDPFDSLEAALLPRLHTAVRDLEICLHEQMTDTAGAA